jgi:pyruvate dehydrogenase E1 component beta subunit
MSNVSFRSAIRETLREEMRRDETVFIMGIDVGHCGLFKVTEGLLDEFGPERVRDTPISEQAIVGAALGAAITGMRPVIELMFSDFVGVAMDQVANQVAKFRYMNGGQSNVPLVIRVATGAGIGFASQHSQNTESWLMNVPGLIIAVPSNPEDAKGLLKQSIRGYDPVVFFEHKLLYQTDGQVEERDHTTPFGSATIRRKGNDVTVIATMKMVEKSLEAARILSQEGIECEVIDPRTLVPLDSDAIITSVKKTGRLVTVEENPKNCSWGGDVVSLVADECISYLKAPIKRITAPGTPIPFSPALEKLWIPNEPQITETIRKAVQYT